MMCMVFFSEGIYILIEGDSLQLCSLLQVTLVTKFRFSIKYLYLVCIIHVISSEINKKDVKRKNNKAYFQLLS